MERGGKRFGGEAQSHEGNSALLLVILSVVGKEKGVTPIPWGHFLPLQGAWQGTERSSSLQTSWNVKLKYFAEPQVINALQNLRLTSEISHQGNAKRMKWIKQRGEDNS